MNMPLFQSHSPDSTYRAATPASGFSTNSDRAKPLPAPSIARALPDVPVARVRSRRDDAEGHDELILGELAGLQHCLVECRLVLHQVIGWKDKHQRVVFAVPGLQQVEGREGEGGSSVSRDRLDYQFRPLHPDLTHLVERQEAVGLVADDHRQRRIQGADAAQGLLEHGAVTDKGNEWLGEMLAGEGPQARARPTGKYHGVYLHYWSSLPSSSICRLTSTRRRLMRRVLVQAGLVPFHIAVDGPQCGLDFALVEELCRPQLQHFDPPGARPPMHRRCAPSPASS